MHNTLILARLKELLGRARYALDTRQWALLRKMKRDIRVLFRLRHCTNLQAIQRMQQA